MRIIGSLLGLQVLKLRNYACDDTTWKTTEGEFKQLEFLLVDESNLLLWQTRSSHFPKLKSIVLRRCPDLRKIPDDIGNISTLELIKVDAGNKYLSESAKIIQEDQERKGNYNIQVCHSTQQRYERSSSVFKGMSDRLKQCFLYMAAFPRDYEIHASEIVKLWVAEGFLRCPTETRSLEEEAKDCLDDLVQRGLIFVIRRKVDGEIKSCRLDDMVRDFCVRQAVEHKFILPLKDYPIGRRDFTRLPIWRIDFQRISASWYDLKDWMHSSSIQTVICILREGYSPEGSLRDYTSLRVLHVLRRNDPSYWEVGEVFDHIHLTYLASNIPSSIVPLAISKLQSLQTLIIYRRGVNLPAEIWRMPQLRHVMAFSFLPLPNPKAADLPLKNLQTLSLVTDFICSRRMVAMIPNIKKLGLYYYSLPGKPRSFWARLLNKWNLSTSDYRLDNLAQLHLEKLKLVITTYIPFWASLPVFPPSLKKLNLTGGGLPWRDMTIIGSLPNLQVLKLRNFACHGEEWKTNNGEFRQLRCLLIDGSDLRNWRAETAPFPRLRCLMLLHCQSLLEIPRQIADIATLELIELDYVSQSLLDSINKMQKGSLEYGGTDKFEIRVNKLYDAKLHSISASAFRA